MKLAIKLNYCSCNKTCKTCTAVVRVLQDLFYVLLQLLVVAAMILSFIASFVACFILLVVAPLSVLVDKEWRLLEQLSAV